MERTLGLKSKEKTDDMILGVSKKRLEEIAKASYEEFMSDSTLKTRSDLLEIIIKNCSCVEEVAIVSMLIGSYYK